MWFDVLSYDALLCQGCYIRNIDFFLLFLFLVGLAFLLKRAWSAQQLFGIFTILKLDKKSMIKISMTLNCLIFESKY